MSYEWRLKNFLDMGCTSVQAKHLAKTRIDLEKARKLIKAGCSPELMERILADTAWWGDEGDDLP
jgi:hypothetical protein